MKRKGIAKRLGRWIAGLVLALLVCLLVLFGLVQTEPGRRQVAKWLAAGLSRGPEFRVTVGRLEGWVPFDARLDHLAVSDQSGEWLSLEDLVLRWSAGQLLHGRLYVHELGVKNARVERLPSPSETGRKREVKIPNWPPEIPPVFVARLTVERLSLGEGVIGEEADFRIEGSMQTLESEDGLKAFLNLQRLDGPTGEAAVDCTVRGVPPVLELDLQVREAETGLLGSAFGLQGRGPLLVKLQGEGPVDAWKGKLSAELEKLGALQASLGLKVGRTLRLTGDGKIRWAASVIPSRLSPLMEDGEGHFSLDASYGDGQELILKEAKLAVRGASLALSGGLDLHKQLVAGEFTLEIWDLSSLEAMAGTRLGGHLAVQGAVSGPLGRPESSLSVDLRQAEVAEVQAEGFTGELQLKLLAPILSSGFPGLRVSGSGAAAGLAHRGSQPLPLKDFQWSVEMLAPSRGPLHIREMGLVGEGLAMEFSGRVDHTARIAAGDLRIESRDLGRFSGLLKKEVSGAAFLQAGVVADGRRSTFSAQVTGQARGLAPLPPPLNALAGSEVRYAGRVEMTEDDRLMLSELKIQSNVASLAGDAALNLASRDLKGQGHLEIRRLGVLSQSAGRPLEGSLELNVDVEGPLSTPRLMARAEADDVLLQGFKFEQAVAILEAEGLPAEPRGSMQLDLQSADQKIHAQSAYALEDGRLRLSGLSLEGLGARVTGDLGVDLRRVIGEGSLQGRIEDLAPISALLGERVDGDAFFEARFSRGTNGQEVVLELQGGHLHTALARTGAYEVRATITDPLGAIQGKAEVNIKELRAGELNLHALSLMTEGRPREASFSAHLRGDWLEELEFQSQGRFTLAPDTGRLELDRLQGHFGDYPVALAQSVVFERVYRDYLLKGADLRLGPGHLRASGRFATEALELDADFEGLPLEFLERFGAPDLQGSASGSVRIRGRPEQPAAGLGLSIAEIRLRGEAFRQIPPANLKAEAKVDGRHLNASTSLEGLTEKPVRGDLQVPVAISLFPFRVALPPEAAIAGRLSGEFNLAPIPAFLDLEDQRLEGQGSIELTATGSARSPEIRGSIRLRNGEYENAKTGTILKEIQVAARVEERRVILQEARATDGGDGIIVAKGKLDLLPSEGFPFQVDLELRKVKLVRRDDLEAVTEGRLRLSGSVQEAVLTGKLSVGPAEIHIPERLPPEITELEVVEINLPEAGKEKRVSQEKAGEGAKVELDLTVDIPGRVFVRGRGLDSEWSGTLGITGDAANPMVRGNLSVVRGRFDFLGKRFAITQGSLALDGSVPPVPRFDVKAENKRSDLTAMVGISGTPSSFSLSLESDPAMPQDEILSRVLFGRSASEITPMQALRLAQAVDRLARGGGGGVLDFMDRTRRLLRVDQLNVEESEAGEGGTAVSVGKYLTDEVFVEAERGLGEKTGKVSVEIELAPNISLETEAGEDAQGGAAIFWRRDY